MATGLAVWLGSAYSFFGEVTVSSTGEVLPCLYGTVAAALSPIPYTVIITLFNPQNFDWADFAKQRLAFEKLDENLTTVDSRTVDAEENLEAEHIGVQGQELKRWGRIAAFWAIATFLGHWVLWPLPMYASNYIFGRSVCSCYFCTLSFSVHAETLLANVAASIHSSTLHGWSSPSSGYGALSWWPAFTPSSTVDINRRWLSIEAGSQVRNRQTRERNRKIRASRPHPLCLQPTSRR